MTACTLSNSGYDVLGPLEEKDATLGDCTCPTTLRVGSTFIVGLLKSSSTIRSLDNTYIYLGNVEVGDDGRRMSPHRRDVGPDLLANREVYCNARATLT